MFIYFKKIELFFIICREDGVSLKDFLTIGHGSFHPSCVKVLYVYVLSLIESTWEMYLFGWGYEKFYFWGETEAGGQKNGWANAVPNRMGVQTRGSNLC